MSIALIGLITMALGGLAVFHSTQMTLRVMCCAGLLGAASALALGSANITPGHLAVGILGASVVLRPRAMHFMSLSLVNGRPGILLVALCAWALISAILLPRLFADQFLVFPMASATKRIMEVPLMPSGSNINQAVYFVSGPIVFFLVSSIARTQDALKNAAFAIIVASTLNLVIVLIDTVTFAAGMSSALDFIRNADYAQLFSHQFMGIKRVTGSFPEASVYSVVATGFFAFNFRLWRGGVFTKYTGIIAALTLFTLLFTFSSTAYVSLMVYLAFAYAGVLVGFGQKNSKTAQKTTNRRVFIALGPILMLIAAIVTAIKPDLLDPITASFDQSVASKLQSSSGVERMSWNMSGLNAFIQTYGLGVGTGGSRTSSFLVAVLANLGVIGAAIYAVFFYQLFRRQAEKSRVPVTAESLEIISAAQAACFITLIGITLSSPSAGPGLHFWVYAGLVHASVFYRRSEPLSPQLSDLKIRNTAMPI